MSILHDDLSLPFQIEQCDVRGRIVRLGPALERMLGRHNYPDPVAHLLAEALTLAATMATALKFDGVFSLQAKGDGPVSTLVADCRTPGGLRGYASFDAARLEGLELGPGGATGLVPLLLGKGYLAFTIDPEGEDMERYQGIVDLSGATLADAAHAYFAQSEQLNARVALGAAHRKGVDGKRHWRAGGILLQQLPLQPGGLTQEERGFAWEKATTLLSTVRSAELADAQISQNDLLYRLFHEDGVRVFEPAALIDRCTCSAEKVRGILSTFAPEEIEGMAVDGTITVTCQFCSASYDFPLAAVQAARG
ncbi:MAG TPA: Hsp33 family molecular chaperone [Ferrovibrio sp.]|uniref:Hsp33 family molecular chaperone n=1 Tax=Ferrovibrio sp. TaxID=1917215 RepID=UPI002ED2CB67